LIIY